MRRTGSKYVGIVGTSDIHVDLPSAHGTSIEVEEIDAGLFDVECVVDPDKNDIM